MTSGWDDKHWEYDMHGDKFPSFWKTIVTSDEWEKWEKEQMRKFKDCKCFDSSKRCTCGVFDIDECRECGWLSNRHWKAFCKFLKKAYCAGKCDESISNI